MKKILMITSEFEPHKNGLGDYCLKLFEELNKIGRCHVITSTSVEKTDNIFPIISKWFSLELFKISEYIQDIDEVNIQYVPTMYSKKGGINFLIPLLVFYLRFFKNKKVSIMFHEVAFPFQKNVKSWVLAIVHRIFAFLLVNFSNKVYASTKYYCKWLNKYSILNKEISFLATPATITFCKLLNTQEEELIGKFNLNLNKVNLLLIGGFHPSKELEAAYEITKKLDVDLLHVGILDNDKDLNKINLTSNQRILGRVSEIELSFLLQKVDYIWGYFVDGATLRRSTLANSISHNCYFLTCLSDKTEEELNSIQTVKFFNSNIEIFKKEVLEIIKNKPKEIRVKPITTFTSVAQTILD